MKKITIRELTIGEGTPKICVPIIGKSKSEILKQANTVIKCEVDMVELRADYYEDLEQESELYSLLESLRKVLDHTPLLFTIRTAMEGGCFQHASDTYLKILQHVIQSNLVDMLDIELSHEAKFVTDMIHMARLHQVITIASHHNFTSTESMDQIRSRLLTMYSTGADVIKVAYMPNEPIDVMHLMLATKEVSDSIPVPVIAISMGELGAISRFCGEVYGSAITFAAIPGQESAPGQLGVDQVRVILSQIHQSHKMPNN